MVLPASVEEPSGEPPSETDSEPGVQSSVDVPPTKPLVSEAVVEELVTDELSSPLSAIEDQTTEQKVEVPAVVEEPPSRPDATSFSAEQDAVDLAGCSNVVGKESGTETMPLERPSEEQKAATEQLEEAGHVEISILQGFNSDLSPMGDAGAAGIQTSEGILATPVPEKNPAVYVEEVQASDTSAHAAHDPSSEAHVGVVVGEEALSTITDALNTSAPAEDAIPQEQVNQIPTSDKPLLTEYQAPRINFTPSEGPESSEVGVSDDPIITSEEPMAALSSSSIEQLRTSSSTPVDASQPPASITEDVPSALEVPTQGAVKSSASSLIDEPVVEHVGPPPPEDSFAEEPITSESAVESATFSHEPVEELAEKVSAIVVPVNNGSSEVESAPSPQSEAARPQSLETAESATDKGE
jgi:hypothetical protein